MATGADIHASDSSGKTALHNAAAGGHLNVVPGPGWWRWSEYKSFQRQTCQQIERKDWHQNHVPQVRLLVGHGPDSLSSDMVAERLTLFDDSNPRRCWKQVDVWKCHLWKVAGSFPSFPALYPATSRSVTKGWDETGCMINAKQHFAVPSGLGFTWQSSIVFSHSLMSHFASPFGLTVLTVHDAKAETNKMQNHYIGQPSKVMLL